MNPPEKEYTPVPVVLMLSLIAAVAGVLLVAVLGVETFPWNLLLLMGATLGVGYLLARSMSVAGLDLALMAVVALVLLVFGAVAVVWGPR